MEGFRFWSFLLMSVLLSFSGVMSQDNTTEVTAVESSNTIIPKAVITVAVISVAFLIGVIVAKLVDMLYARQAIRDDASDISEYTKDLLKLQFMTAFNKKTKGAGGKESPEDIARRMTKLWRIGVAKKKAQRKLDAKKAEMEIKQEAMHPKDKKDKKADEDKEKGGKATPVNSATKAPAKLETISEKPQPPPDTSKSNLEIKPQQAESKTSAVKADEEKGNKEAETENKTNKLEVEQPSNKDQESTGNGIKPKNTQTYSSPPSGTAVVIPPSPHKTYTEFRADSEDLLIPVSTDENPRPTLKVTSTRRESATSSKSDYEFLKDPDIDSVQTGRSVPDDDNLAKTPSSVSGVKLESSDRDPAKVHAPLKRKPSQTAERSPLRPTTAKTRAGPISGRPKSAAPPLITPTGRRPVSGKIVTPQGVKVVSRPAPRQ